MRRLGQASQAGAGYRGDQAWRGWDWFGGGEMGWRANGWPAVSDVMGRARVGTPQQKPERGRFRKLPGWGPRTRLHVTILRGFLCRPRPVGMTNH